MENEKVIGILNDLIRINNDRVVGYEKAIEEVEDLDVDLKTRFCSKPTHSNPKVQAIIDELIP